jgi:membrane dipeptidase
MFRDGTISMSDATAVHSEAVVIDGLVYHCDGHAAEFRQANAAAANITVCDFEADFTEACDRIAKWLDLIARGENRWRLIERVDDIGAAADDGDVGLIMGFQNARPIGDQLDRIDLFHRLGVRIIQLTYNNRNFLGDGCLEPVDGGLSAFGRRAIERMNVLGVAIDLSHVGERTSLMAAEASARPVLATHANAKALADWPRNKSDDVIRAIAATGGTIGVSIYGPLLWNGLPGRPPSLNDLVRQAEYVAGLVGIEHLSFGTDFFSVGDPATYSAVVDMESELTNPAAAAYAAEFGNALPDRYPPDCRRLANLSQITDAFMKSGWSADDVKALLGGNLRRVFGSIWT